MLTFGVFENIWNTLVEFGKNSGIFGFFQEGGWKNIVMLAVACVLIFLAIKKRL